MISVMQTFFNDTLKLYIVKPIILYYGSKKGLFKIYKSGINLLVDKTNYLLEKAIQKTNYLTLFLYKYERK